jgi:hypothetical protein
MKLKARKLFKKTNIVALGGNLDKSGYVFRSTLMKTIVDEFGIALDSNSQIPGFQGFEQ